MRRLRDSILTLLIHFAIFFNIERLDIGAKNIIDIDSAIYILTFIAVILVISVRRLRSLRQPVLISLWTGLFFVVKLVFLFRRPIIGGVYTYLLFTELGLYIVAIILAQNLGLQLEEFRQAVENFTFDNIRKIKPIQDAVEEIQNEFYRSRRHQRPLSLVVIEQDPDVVQVDINKVVQDAQRTMLQQYVSVMLAKELSIQLRRTDMLFENDKKGNLVILSPDTDSLKAQALRDRIELISRHLGVFVRLGVASFPDHALTFEQLLEEAELNLHNQVDERVGVEVFEKVDAG